MRLSPRILIATYETLLGDWPFSKWNLPPSTELIFKIVSHKKYYGFYMVDNGVESINISKTTVRTELRLLMVMAHEMLHVMQYRNGLDNRIVHNKDFKERAKIVCDYYGFNYVDFV